MDLPEVQYSSDSESQKEQVSSIDITNDFVGILVGKIKNPGKRGPIGPIGPPGQPGPQGEKGRDCNSVTILFLEKDGKDISFFIQYNSGVQKLDNIILEGEYLKFICSGIIVNVNIIKLPFGNTKERRKMKQYELIPKFEDMTDGVYSITIEYL